MSARRQRIKAAANLSQSKRKAPKEEPQETSETVRVETVSEPETAAQLEQEELLADNEQDEAAFKMPAASTGQLEEAFYSDIEDNVIQMDLHKSSNYPMSPSKVQARQRVRPTPVFGHRRNSFVGSPLNSDNECSNQGDHSNSGSSTRRERYLSNSSSTGGPSQQGSPMSQSLQKYLPVTSPGMGRIRTESGCSVYSDAGSPAGGKQRKADSGEKSQQMQQRINARRDFETRFNNGVPDKSTFKMFDMIYYNPGSNPMDQKPVISTIKAENSDETKPTPEHLLITKTEPPIALAVPQLKLDANGEMIIDEKTLEIETTAEVEARKVLANSSLILMDETTGNNGFYRRKQRTRGWSPDETVRFYRSLQIIGTDFSLMCQMFPQRSRRDLKLKYKKEERLNPQLINKALLHPKAFNIQELKDQLEIEDREKAEEEKQWKEIVSADANVPKKSSKCKRSKEARALSDGDLIYKNEHVIKSKMGKHALARRRAALYDDKNNDDKSKSRRRGKLKLEDQQNETPMVSPIASIKEEAIVKTEQICKLPASSSKDSEQLAPQQLEQELSVLLNDEEENGMDGSPIEPQAAPFCDKTDSMDIDYIVMTDVEESPLTDKISRPASPEHMNITDVDIEQVLKELEEGTMVLVASQNCIQEDGVFHEIYMRNSKTGQLDDKPLEISQHIVQCILNVIR